MDKIKMAIIGAGVWGATHASIYEQHPMVEVVAVCDKNKDKAMAVASRFGIDVDHVYADHKEMIKACDFDAASVVTPDFLHRDFAVDLANAHKHILLEKPIATTYQDTIDILEAVDKSGVRLMVDLHNRFSPPFAVAKASLDAGELGDPYSAYFRLNDKKYVATTMLSWAAQSSILWFLGSHSLDTLRWFFGDEVKTVYSVSRQGVMKDLGVDTDDMFQTILTFRNGGIATMENSWITPDTYPNINDIKFNITGTKGMINLDLTNSQMIERFTETKNDRPDILVNHFVHGYPAGFAYESIRHFVDRLVDGKPFLISVEDAANTTFAILSILESAKSREPVDVRYV